MTRADMELERHLAVSRTSKQKNTHPIIGTLEYCVSFTRFKAGYVGDLLGPACAHRWSPFFSRGWNGCRAAWSIRGPLPETDSTGHGLSVPRRWVASGFWWEQKFRKMSCRGAELLDYGMTMTEERRDWILIVVLLSIAVGVLAVEAML